MPRPHSRRFLRLAPATLKQVEALSLAIGAHARRHPTDPVPEAVARHARPLLHLATAITSSERGAVRHQLGPAPLWAELDMALQLASADLALFSERRQSEPDAEGERIRDLLIARIAELKRGTGAEVVDD